MTVSELTDGTYSITASAEDLAGNVSVPSASTTVTIETVPPAAPSGPRLAAVRHLDFKIHLLPGSHGGLPAMEFYNVRRDPGEKRGEFYPGLYAVTPVQMILKSHLLKIREFPHRVSETMPQGAELTPHD